MNPNLNWNYERWRTRDRLQEYTNPPYPYNMEPTQPKEEEEEQYGEHND